MVIELENYEAIIEKRGLDIDFNALNRGPSICGDLSTTL